MNKNLIKTRRTTANLLLGFMLISAISPVANALAFDWSFGANHYIASTSSQTFGFISPLFNLDSQLSTDGAGNNNDDLAVSSNSFLLPAATSNSKKVVPSISAVKNEVFVSLTAYSSTPDQTDASPFITANGSYVRDGIIAANFLPFGTRVKIPELFGDKVFVVEDRMNRRYWYKVDIWFPDRASAIQFGLKKAMIQILES
jgi:3D (Asp-Asp-Asp) domain-containing protein